MTETPKAPPTVKVYARTPLAALANPVTRTQLFDAAPKARLLEQRIAKWFTTDEYWRAFSSWDERRRDMREQFDATVASELVPQWLDYVNTLAVDVKPRELLEVELPVLMALPALVDELRHASTNTVVRPLASPDNYSIAVDAARTRVIHRPSVREWMAYLDGSAVVATTPDAVFQHVVISSTASDVHLLLAALFKSETVAPLEPKQCMRNVHEEPSFALPHDVAIDAFRVAWQKYAAVSERTTGVRLL
jgi:hypothetical protein